MKYETVSQETLNMSNNFSFLRIQHVINCIDVHWSLQWAVSQWMSSFPSNEETAYSTGSLRQEFIPGRERRNGAENTTCVTSTLWQTPICQQGTFLVARCRRVCLARWSLRMKRLWHMGQAKRFSPVWVLRWRDSSSDRAKRLSQPSHLHLKGFSPEQNT